MRRWRTDARRRVNRPLINSSSRLIIWVWTIIERVSEREVVECRRVGGLEHGVSSSRGTVRRCSLRVTNERPIAFDDILYRCLSSVDSRRTARDLWKVNACVKPSSVPAVPLARSPPVSQGDFVPAILKCSPQRASRVANLCSAQRQILLRLRFSILREILPAMWISEDTLDLHEGAVYCLKM